MEKYGADLAENKLIRIMFSILNNKAASQFNPLAALFQHINFWESPSHSTGVSVAVNHTLLSLLNTPGKARF